MTRICKLAILIILQLLLSSAFGAEESLKYDISADVVSSVCISKSSDYRYSVTIHLLDPIRLLRLSSENIGKKLTIVLAGRTLTAPVIKASINSGTIGIAEVVSIQEAFELIDFILANTKSSKDS